MPRTNPQNSAVYGIDLGKNVFHVVGFDDTGAVVQRVRLRRDTLLSFFERANAAIVGDRKSTRLNSSHDQISYAVFCL